MMSCPFSIIASETFPNGCDVIWSIREWRHWTSIWESEKQPYIWELDVDLSLTHIPRSGICETEILIVIGVTGLIAVLTVDQVTISIIMTTHIMAHQVQFEKQTTLITKAALNWINTKSRIWLHLLLLQSLVCFTNIRSTHVTVYCFILSSIFNVLPVVKNVTKCMAELDQGHLLIPLSWKWFSKSVLILYEGYFFSSISITVCINSNFILVNCPHYHTLTCIN